MPNSQNVSTFQLFDDSAISVSAFEDAHQNRRKPEGAQVLK